MIDLQNVEIEYITGTVSFKALKGVTLRIEQGEYIGVVGPSGSGNRRCPPRSHGARRVANALPAAL